MKVRSSSERLGAAFVGQRQHVTYYCPSFQKLPPLKNRPRHATEFALHFKTRSFLTTSQALTTTFDPIQRTKFSYHSEALQFRSHFEFIQLFFYPLHHHVFIMSERTSTPRVTAQYLSSYTGQNVIVVGKVLQLRGDSALLDSQGNVTLNLNRVSL